MKTSIGKVFWGLALIAGGGLFLAQNLGLVDFSTWPVKAGILAGFSLLFLIVYLLEGLQKWGWLFPASIFAGVAAVPLMTANGVYEAAIPTVVLGSVALPFLVGFALKPRQRWGLLIPAYALLCSGALTLFGERLDGAVIGGLVVLSISLPFFYVTLSRKEAWWATIPAGVLASVGLTVIALGSGLEQGGLAWMADSLIPLGWAATFFALWLRRATQPTRWAIYPAAALGASALVSLVSQTLMNFAWPVLLILAGMAVLYWSIRKQRSA